MFKHTKKILASLFILAGITLFISCQDQTPVATNDAGQMNLSKVSTLIIPAGATVVEANLKLWAHSWAATPHNIDVHSITADWSCPTWNTFAEAYNPAVITSFNTNTVVPTWLTIDITSTVMGWLGGDPNYGVLLKNQVIAQGLAQWFSNEYVLDPTLRPYLEVILSTNDTIEVEPLYDTYISSIDPDNSFCTEEKLYSGRVDLGSGPTDKYTLIRFDIEPPTQEVCETAYAFGDTPFCGLPNINNWGWTEYINGNYTNTNIPIYAGAAQCDPSKGVRVGTLSITYVGTSLTVNYTLDAGYDAGNVHVWIGSTPLPVKNGKLTSAPGQFNYQNPTFPLNVTKTAPFYIAVHSEVCHEEFLFN